MYDIIIKKAKIVDGTGNLSFIGDIAIKDSKIIQVGNIANTAEVVIDATGLVACPGFIDPHSHPDFTFSFLPLCHNYIMQGITTVVGGNCGLSQAPIKKAILKTEEQKVGLEALKAQRAKKDLSFSRWLTKVERRGLSINYIPLIGHNTVRDVIMGEDYKRHAKPEEIEAMKELVEEGMKSGAFGFSTGLDYDPSEYCNTEEIIELAKVAKKYGGIYVSHLRHCHSQWATNDPNLFGYGVFHGEIEEAWIGKYQGLMEAIEIGKKANIPVQFAHIYTVYVIPQPHPDFLDEATARATLWLIDKTKEEGVDITFDVIVSDTSIAPCNLIINEFIMSRLQKLKWLRGIDKDEFVEKIKNNNFREKIKQLSHDGYLKFGMVHTKADPYWMNRFKITHCKNKNHINKIIGELAKESNKDALDLIFDLIIEDSEVEWVQFAEDRGINFMTLPIYLSHPLCMPCTDMFSLPSLDFSMDKLKSIDTGIPEEFYNSINTPHYYGMYANYIGRFVRDTCVLTLENAIKKATSFVAQRFKLKDRGIIKPNYYGDILIFDFDKIKMIGDLLNPRQAPEGIEYVLVNGQITYKDKKHTGIKAGKVLRHSKMKS
jgi:N-acyl-D-amino-acid deacylase